MAKSIHRLVPRESSYLNEVQLLHDELRKDGYVYIESPSEITEVVEQLARVSKKFFGLPVKEKLKYAYSLGINERRKYFTALRKRHSLLSFFRRSIMCFSCSSNRRGNVQVGSSSSVQRGKFDPNPREYFDMTKSVEKFYDAEFEHTLKDGLVKFNHLAEEYLELLLYPLRVNMDYVRDVARLDRDSLTTLRLLKYYYRGDAEKETCLRHTDRGLLTLAYCQEGGLTAKDFHTHQWVDIEAAAPSRPCLILFTGETLSRLTGGYFKALLHKVVSQEDRFSFPFFYRGRTPAVLDMSLMNSAELNERLAAGQLEQLPPITVGDLDSITTKQYASNSIPLELGEFKKDPYYVFADELDEV